jgi:16S rRNA C967 or C1407 C5-methylase (RsmB/RsmF family)
MDRNSKRQDRIDRSLAWFQRYEPLFDDPVAFRAALEEPPPLDLLVPPGRVSVEQVGSLLAARDITSQRFSWAPHHVRAEISVGAGTLPEVIFGFAHPQGVSSALPPLALAPQPGERVLDLCAAPGGKTLYMALLANDRARVIAGDAVMGRTGPLVLTLSRNAISSVVVVAGDSSSMPAVGTVDAILLDAPCSGEGTFRMPSPKFEPRGEDQLSFNPPQQRRLLQRALDLLRPGGRLLYSTCAFAPEENEAVLAHVLDQRDDTQLVPLPSYFPGIPGVELFNGAHFGARMQLTRRVFPHHGGSWGFFVALLIKSQDSTQNAKLREIRETALPTHDASAAAIVRSVFHDDFGVPLETLDQFDVIPRGRDLWLRHRLPAGVDDLPLDRLRVVAPGLRAVHVTRTGPRATTISLRRFGPEITRNVVELSFEDAARSWKGDPVPAPAGLTRRPQALRVAGWVVGSITNEEGASLLHIPGDKA